MFSHKHLLTFAGAALLGLALAPAQAESPLPGLIVASVYRADRWNLYLIAPTGQLVRRLTDAPGPDRAPRWSPDGTRIAFESHRGGNWDIYTINADGSGLQRLTTDPHFDGSPAWSPDGKQIAFVSYRAGDLDIWVMDADGRSQTNLTPNDPDGDLDPTWSPDGQQIAFISWRNGNKEIYIMNADGSAPRRITNTPDDESEPAWSPDGKRLAFVRHSDAGREIFILDLASGVEQPVTNFGDDRAPRWSPNGLQILYVAGDAHSQTLRLVTPGQLDSRAVTTNPHRYQTPDWTDSKPASSVPAQLPPDPEGPSNLYQEKTHQPGPEHKHPYEFVRLPGVRAQIPKLSDAVDDSFNALRARVRAETGHDFLGTLSESLRPIDFRSMESDYMSWHKAGRAIDTQLDYFDERGDLLMRIVREDILGETWWRVYLKAARQDGSQGEPMRERFWDFSRTARWTLRPGEGGRRGVVPAGYWVDFTALAVEYGWNRISAHDEPDFDWRSNKTAMEYWHFQKTEGLTWWAAIQQVYSLDELPRDMLPAALLQARQPLQLLLAKGVPLPATVMRQMNRIAR